MLRKVARDVRLTPEKFMKVIEEHSQNQSGSAIELMCRGALVDQGPPEPGGSSLYLGTGEAWDSSGKDIAYRF